MTNDILHDFKRVGEKITQVYLDIEQLRSDVGQIGKIMSNLYSDLEGLPRSNYAEKEK